MPPPPRPGFVAEKARTDDEHREYKSKVAGKLVDKILAEKDPAKRFELEMELGKGEADHFDPLAQPNWPLHDWPWKGPMFTKDMIPKSHFIAKAHLMPEDQCYVHRSWAEQKYLNMFEARGMHAKFNPRRVVLVALVLVGYPSLLFQIVRYSYWKRDLRAGRLPSNNRFMPSLSKKHRKPLSVY